MTTCLVCAAATTKLSFYRTILPAVCEPCVHAALQKERFTLPIDLTLNSRTPTFQKGIKMSKTLDTFLAFNPNIKLRVSTLLCSLGARPTDANVQAMLPFVFVAPPAGFHVAAALVGKSKFA